MNDELMNRARELLALRDKATPGPWHVELGGFIYPKNVRAKVTDCGVSNSNNSYFIAAAHDMADTIRDLLAEVERLESRLRELASAEAVAWMIEGDPQNLETAGSPAFDIPLIRRPSMEIKP